MKYIKFSIPSKRNIVTIGMLFIKTHWNGINNFQNLIRLEHQSTIIGWITEVYILRLIFLVQITASMFMMCHIRKPVSYASRLQAVGDMAVDLLLQTDGKFSQTGVERMGGGQGGFRRKQAAGQLHQRDQMDRIERMAEHQPFGMPARGLHVRYRNCR